MVSSEDEDIGLRYQEEYKLFLQFCGGFVEVDTMQ